MSSVNVTSYIFPRYRSSQPFQVISVSSGKLFLPLHERSTTNHANPVDRKGNSQVKRGHNSEMDEGHDV